jgi:hypothetical protein
MHILFWQGVIALFFSLNPQMSWDYLNTPVIWNFKDTLADRDCPLSGPNLLFFEIEAPSLSISHSCKTPQHIIFLVVWFSQRVIMFNISYTSYNKLDSLIILSNHESYNVQNINIWERCKYCLSIICFIYVLWIITSFIFFYCVYYYFVYLIYDI